jgi:hypothetical protein
LGASDIVLSFGLALIFRRQTTKNRPEKNLGRAHVSPAF